MPGGSRHYSLAKELVKRGHKVTIIASNFRHGTGGYNIELQKKEKCREEIVDGIKFLWLDTPHYEGNTPRRLLNMAVFSLRARFNKLLIDRASKPDVVIGSSPHPCAALAAQRLASLHRIPFVLEVRDLWPQSLVDLGRISKYHPFIILLAWLERYLYKKAAGIIVLLPGAAEYIENLGIKREKIVWMPNGIDMDLLPDVNVSEKKNGKFTVMYTGSHGLANSLETLIRSAKILQDEKWEDKIIFRLVGGGPEKLNLRKLAEELKLKNIIFEDPVPKKEVYKKMKEADIFVICAKKVSLYRWGMSPNKLFDYFVMAKPIIWAIEAFNDPVKEAGAGISIPPEDPVALAEAVKEIFYMKYEDRLEMGLRGREYVIKNHDFKILASRLENALLDLIEKTR
jgi:glycosyltransferase involved in cell wall biosynthesis